MEEKGKILIVDDNEDVLFALNLLLEPYMEKIKVTTQPNRIKHFMETFHPDVILLDMTFCHISNDCFFIYMPNSKHIWTATNDPQTHSRS